MNEQAQFVELKLDTTQCSLYFATHTVADSPREPSSSDASAKTEHAAYIGNLLRTNASRSHRSLHETRVNKLIVESDHVRRLLSVSPRLLLFLWFV